MFQQKRLEKLGESNPWTLKSEFNQVLSKPCHYVFADGISQRILRKRLFWKKSADNKKSRNISQHATWVDPGFLERGFCVGGSLC